ncbi:MAG: flagellar biosynthetic protein FliR [Armatimonadota bacterium]|jgi:flagellar biosynthetic protein FliR
MIEVFVLLIEQAADLLPAGLRVVGLAAVAPGLSYQQAPVPVRVALALALAVVIAPVATSSAPQTDQPIVYVAVCAAELGFGIALGFVVSAVLEALRFGGEMLDLQIGLRAGQLFDPVSGAHSGILSTGYYMLALIFFVTLDGHHWLLRGVADSFAIVPVGGITLGADLAALVSNLGTSLLVLGLRVAGPVMVALLLADLALGLVARAVPQINVFLVGIPAKIALAFAIAAVGMPMLLHNIGQITRVMATYMDAVLRAFAG